MAWWSWTCELRTQQRSLCRCSTGLPVATSGSTSTKTWTPQLRPNWFSEQKGLSHSSQPILHNRNTLTPLSPTEPQRRTPHFNSPHPSRPRQPHQI